MKNLLLIVFIVVGLTATTQTQSFTTTGTNSFAIPASVTSIKVECVGAGGAGGRVTPSNPLDKDAAGGGGGGAAGSNGIGFNGGEISGGGTQSNYGGYGGQGGPDGASGADGGNYGGGGGGSSANGSNDRDGGEGADGIVVISWCTITSISPQQVCADGVSQITIQGTNFSAIDSVVLNNEQLSFSLVSSTEITVTITTNSTTGPLKVFTQNGSAQSLDTLQVQNETVSVFISGFNELAANYSGSNGTYQWIDCANGNSPISGATNETEVFNQNGVYAVQVEENGCTVTSSCFVFSSADVEQHEINQYKIYPNPGTNQLFINTDEKLILRIVNISGQLVKEINNTKSIDASQLESGIYFIQILDPSSMEIMSTEKWVKK